MTINFSPHSKAAVAALAGAISTIAAYYLGWPAMIQGAVTTIITTLGVWIVPNQPVTFGDA